MREVRCKGAKVTGEKIVVSGIYVRSGVALPEAGEPAVVINPETADEFAARVTRVDHIERRYDLSVDLRRVDG